MSKTYTLDSLVELLYREVTPKEMREILEVVFSNYEYQEAFIDMNKGIKILDREKLRDPHPTSIDIIKKYSQQTNPYQKALLEEA